MDYYVSYRVGGRCTGIPYFKEMQILGNHSVTLLFIPQIVDHGSYMACHLKVTKSPVNYCIDDLL